MRVGGVDDTDPGTAAKVDQFFQLGQHLAPGLHFEGSAGLTKSFSISTMIKTVRDGSIRSICCGILLFLPDWLVVATRANLSPTLTRAYAEIYASNMPNRAVAHRFCSTASDKNFHAFSTLFVVRFDHKIFLIAWVWRGLTFNFG